MQAYQDDIDLSGVVGALKRGLPRIVVMTLIAGASTYGLLSLVPPTYKSTAQVILEPANSSLLGAGSQPGGLEVRIDENEVASQVEVIRSRDILRAVAAKERLDSLPEFNPALPAQSLVGRIAKLFGPTPAGNDPVERAIGILEQNLRVNEIPKTRLINIDVFSLDAKLVARLANEIAEGYLDRNRQSQVKDADEATTSIDASLAAIKQESEAADAQLERFRAESGLLSGQNNVTFNNQQLSELNTQLTQATAARTEAEARSRILRDMIASGHVADSQDVVKSPNMQQLFQEKVRVERDIAELSATLLPAHPRMRQLAAELETTNTRLREEAKQVAAGIEDDLKVASAREAALEASIAHLTDIALKSSDAQAKLGSLEREAQSKRNAYDGLLQRLSQASNRRNNAAVSAMASLNESAIPATLPDSPKKAQMSLFATLGALLLGLVWVIGRELMAGGKPGEAALSAAPATRVMQKARAGSLGELASALVGEASKAGAGRVLLTGELANQDLAPVTCGLAEKLAVGSTSVVLIDFADAGNGTERTAGFAELVAGKASFEDVVHAPPGGRWHRIGAGRLEDLAWTPGPSGNVAPVLDALGAIYNTVLISADRTTATRLLEALEGQLDHGVVCAAADRSGAAAWDGGFLGYDVAGLPVTWLDLPKVPKVKSFSRRAALKLGPSPA